MARSPQRAPAAPPRPPGRRPAPARRALAAGLALAASSLAPAVLAGALGGCGYAVSAGLKLEGGAARAAVRPFEDLSSDPGVGAEVAAALRRALARRGAEGGDGAILTGEVRTGAATPSLPGGAMLRVALTVTARLTVGGAVVAERTVRREADHLGGADALEGEARRAQALQRLAAEVARELVESFEE